MLHHSQELIQNSHLYHKLHDSTFISKLFNESNATLAHQYRAALLGGLAGPFGKASEFLNDRRPKFPKLHRQYQQYLAALARFEMPAKARTKA